MKKNQILLLFLFCAITQFVSAQTEANSNGDASAVSKLESTGVNYFTGLPSISIPIYNYTHPNSIGLAISLDYNAGGIKVNEQPSSVGLGWNLNMGGIITRTVKGLPDDCPGLGYLYNSLVQSDSRAQYHFYEKGVTDAEQDVFQYSFNGRSGKFFIGKDTSIMVSPISNIKITFSRRYIGDDVQEVYTEPNEQYEKPPFASVFATINSFKIQTEDGVQYFFEEKNNQKTSINTIYQQPTYPLLKYASSWHLTKIVSAIGGDTIKINYAILPQQSDPYIYQTATITNGNTTHSDTSSLLSGLANRRNGYGKIPTTVTLPNNKSIQFYYSRDKQFRFGNSPLLQRIKFQDSTLRYGYILNWDTTNLGANSKCMLTGVDYFNSNVLKKGYQFTYNNPVFNINNSQLNSKDHWGYYNGKNLNSNDFVPNVFGLYTGADRSVNSNAKASTLATIKDPKGSTTYYDYENNDIYPFTSTKQQISIDVANNTSSNISLSKVLGSKTYFYLKYNLQSSVYGTNPISETAKLILKITDVTGTNVLSTDTVNLYELYTLGYSVFSTNVINGNYLIKTSLSSGTTCSINFPIELSWFNQNENSSVGNLVGGLRVKRIIKFEPFANKFDTISTYNYVLQNGKSAGFIGKEPVYHYNFNIGQPGTQTILQSSFLNELDYSQGLTVGYSRVEVISGSVFKNLGKTVYEYTGINEYSYDNSPATFPYFPVKRNDYSWGLPKKKTIYDNTGRKIQTTDNEFRILTINLKDNPNFRSINVFSLSDFYASSNNEKYKDYCASFEYPSIGRADLINTVDSFFYANNSYTIQKKSVQYDDHYNVSKIITNYDKYKNLNLEKRLYYTYNYTLSGPIGFIRDKGIELPISSESWIVGDANPRLLAIDVVDYSFLRNGVLKWLKPTIGYSMYTNKPIPQSTIGVFNPQVLIRDTNLIKPKQLFNYLKNGGILETTDFKSNKSNSQIYSDDYNQTIATVSNAKITDVAYTSFEPNASGGWYYTNNAFIDSTKFITGRNSYQLINFSNSITKAGLNSGTQYIISYWAIGNIQVVGSPNTNYIDERGEWKLYQVKVTNVTEVSILGAGNIDELRLFPVDAYMTTVCYNKNDEVISTADANNNIIYTEYDFANRVSVVRDINKNIIKKLEYSEPLVNINIQPNWVYNIADSNLCRCEKDTLNINTGNLLRIEFDINPMSETYLSAREVFYRLDNVKCPPPAANCGSSPNVRSVNGVCEFGQKITTSSVYKKTTITSTGNVGFIWVCTYHYLWSDGYVSQDYTEQSTTSCPLTSNQQL